MVTQSDKISLYNVYQDPGYLRFIGMGSVMLPSAIPPESEYNISYGVEVWEEYGGKGTYFTIIVDISSESWDIISEISGNLRVFPCGGEIWRIGIGVDTGENVAMFAELDTESSKEVSELLMDGEGVGIKVLYGDEERSNRVLPKEGNKKRYDDALLEGIGSDVDIETCIEHIPDDWNLDDFQVL